MFWKRKQRQAHEATQTLVELFLRGNNNLRRETSQRGAALASQVKQTLQKCPRLNLNEEIIPISPPEQDQGQQQQPIPIPLTPLTALICSSFPESTKLTVLDVLLSHGGRASWSGPWQHSDYGLAVQKGEFKVAQSLLYHALGSTSHHHHNNQQQTESWKALCSSAMAIVFRSALAYGLKEDIVINYQHNSDDEDDQEDYDAFQDAVDDTDDDKPNSSTTSTSTTINTTSTTTSQMDTTRTTGINTDGTTGTSISTSSSSSCMLSDVIAPLPPHDMSWFNTSLEHAQWLVQRCGKKTLLKQMKPWGARSVVHCILESFAEQVENQARIKRLQMLNNLQGANNNNGDDNGNNNNKKRQQEEELKQKMLRSRSVTFILRRLWALLHVAVEAGAPVIDVDVSTFPAVPANATCDHDKIWDSIKTFATSWPSHWSRSQYSLYHPNFRAATETLLLIGRCRGFTAKVSSEHQQQHASSDYNTGGGGSGGGGEGGQNGQTGQSLGQSGNRKKVRYWVDGGILEKVVEMMAMDQRAWTDTIGDEGVVVDDDEGNVVVEE